MLAVVVVAWKAWGAFFAPITNPLPKMTGLERFEPLRTAQEPGTAKVESLQNLEPKYGAADSDDGSAHRFFGSEPNRWQHYTQHS